MFFLVPVGFFESANVKNDAGLDKVTSTGTVTVSTSVTEAYASVPSSDNFVS
jgi:hypothetical protein